MVLTVMVVGEEAAEWEAVEEQQPVLFWVVVEVMGRVAAVEVVD